MPSTYNHTTIRTFLPLITLILLCSCSSIDTGSSIDLNKQIERQQIEHDLMSNTSVQDNRTAPELESLGDRYLLKGDINRAYIYYLKGLQIEPEKVSLIHKRGALLLKKNKLVEAKTVYEKLLSKDSRDILALEGLGKVYFGQGLFSEAEETFLTVINTTPDRWQSHEFMGLIYSRGEKQDQAIFHFKVALSYQPTEIRIINNLAVSYYLNANFKEAALLLERFTNISNNPKIHNNLALCYFQLGFYEKSLESFKRGSDDDAVAYNNMGYEYFTKKEFTEAVQAFEKAISLYPKYYPSAQQNLEVAKREMLHSVADTGQ